MFLLAAWTQSLCSRADRQRLWSGLTSVPFVVVGSVTVVRANMQGRCSGLAPVLLFSVDSITVLTYR
jgi:hypothetical protein